MPTKRPILIVEDDTDIAHLLQIHLRDLEYPTEHAKTGLEGWQKAENGNYALVILDIMLPLMDGLEVCRKIRHLHPALPILMLTAKSEELDKVLGLELGADDYLTKPFSIRELIARVKALLRRASIEPIIEPKAPILKFDNLVIDTEKRKIWLKDREIELTTKEFDLLLLFAQHPGRAYSRQELLDLVWGYQYIGYSHTVNSHINRLRTKIEDNIDEPAYIKTVWGLGYRFREA